MLYTNGNYTVDVYNSVLCGVVLSILQSLAYGQCLKCIYPKLHMAHISNVLPETRKNDRCDNNVCYYM